MNADTLLHWLLRTSLEASLLILAVLGLRLMLGARLSPAWRIGLWLLVGAKLLLPAFIPAGFGLGAWFHQDEAIHINDAATAELISSAGFIGPTDSGSPLMVSDSIGGIFESAEMFSGHTLALGLWMMGALFVFAAALYRQRHFDLALRQRPLGSAALLRALVASLCQKAGIRKNVRIVLMPASTTPAVVGIVQPSILLPEDWETRFDEHSLRHVLLHELLHVKQHDLIWNWAATAVQALHWFNPLVWFIMSRFQADRELRCDAGALELLSPTERLDYGHTLLRIQETFFAPPAMAGLAPCVRNHPTLRQRIHMIAHPTTRQPVIQMLLVLTLSVLVCYSFTTARAVEKEVPAKERSRDGARTPSAEQTKTASSQEGTPARTREGDGGTKKTGMREGDSGIKKPGTGDGEGGRKTGAREGDGESRKPGPRDGEGSTKTGMRDGEKPRTGGEREGDGGRKTGARDGGKAAFSGETITLKVIKNGEAVMVGDQEVSMGGLRGHLSTFLPDHPGAKVVVTGEDNVPLGALHNTVDAVRDNGNKNVGIKAE
jgi:bla regulator protein BlaR1